MGGCSKNKDSEEKGLIKDIQDNKKAAMDAIFGSSLSQASTGGAFKIADDVKSFLIIFSATGKNAGEADITAHQSYLTELVDGEKVERFGAFPNGGGMLLLAAKSEADAREIVNSDPLVANGVHSVSSVNEIIT